MLSVSAIFNFGFLIGAVTALAVVAVVSILISKYKEKPNGRKPRK
jgi:hypothetical protein